MDREFLANYASIRRIRVEKCCSENKSVDENEISREFDTLEELIVSCGLEPPKENEKARVDNCLWFWCVNTWVRET